MGAGVMRAGLLAVVVGACLLGMAVVGSREGVSDGPVALLVLVGAVLVMVGNAVGLFGLLRRLTASNRQERRRRRGGR